jgi:plastocyanin
MKSISQSVNKTVLVLSMLGFILISGISLMTYYVSASDDKKPNARSDNDSRRLNNATVSFGGWMTTPSLDRFPNVSPIPANHHALTPETVRIKAGGTVNFIIGGFHQIAVYDNGTRPEQINTNLLITPTVGNLPRFLIDDPNRRIYRGLDPSTQSQDRVEVIQFDRPGIYLVICTVRPHFVNDRMYGFVRVLPNNEDDDDRHGSNH